jgi:DNA replication protein DnaC
MPEQLIADRLVENLTRLRLSRVTEIFRETIETAENESWSYLTLLDRLLDEEVVTKEQRRIANALRTSGLPYVKTIDEFDFAFQPGINRQQIMNLFDLSFLDRKESPMRLLAPHIAALSVSSRRERK